MAPVCSAWVWINSSLALIQRFFKTTSGWLRKWFSLMFTTVDCSAWVLVLVFRQVEIPEDVGVVMVQVQSVVYEALSWSNSRNLLVWQGREQKIKRPLKRHLASARTLIDGLPTWTNKRLSSILFDEQTWVSTFRNSGETDLFKLSWINQNKWTNLVKL